MSNYASKVLKIAKAEVGYLEKKSNKNLYASSSNPGYNNFTKYAADLDKIDGFYNGKKNGYAWCAVWVDWCFVQAFGVEVAKKITYHTNCGAGCTLAARQYKNAGRLFDTPKVGDEIFFKDSSGGCSHTGLVYNVDDEYVYTYEGNTSAAQGVVANGGAVEKKKYKLGYYKIYGYGRPLYDAEPKKATKKAYSGTFPVLPARGYLQKGDTGTQVRNLQKFLNWYGGYDLVVDGDFGSKTLAAVKDFQKKNSLSVDGLFGAKSLAKAKAIKK